jgi:hypothetical protein
MASLRVTEPPRAFRLATTPPKKKQNKREFRGLVFGWPQHPQGQATPILVGFQYKAGRSKTMSSFMSTQTKPTDPKPASPLFVFMSVSFSIPSLNLMHLHLFPLSLSLGNFRCDNWIPIFRILALWAISFSGFSSN